MSPEQHRGQNADSRSDQFSFCAALYQALYGVAPFAGSTLSELSRNVLSGQLRPPPRSQEIPARIGEALQRGLKVEPGLRYPSMAELLAAITLDVHSDPAAAPGARRFFASVMVGAMAVSTALIYLLNLERYVTLPLMIAAEGSITLAAFGLAFLMRRSLRENAFHRGMVKILLILGTQVLCLRIVSYLLGLTVRQVLIIEQVLIAGICAVMGVYHLPGGWVLAAGYAAMALALGRFAPQLAPLAPASYLVLTIAVAALWARAARKLPATRARRGEASTTSSSVSEPARLLD
jgi:hypothetical protein